MEGPISKLFLKKNKLVSRTIQIRGDQTLEDLHEAIFSAYDRDDEHMYEFQVGGKGPMDPKSRRYVLSYVMEDPIPGPRKPAGDVALTAINEVGLKKDEAFGYLFDFGDNWWHQINVIDIGEAAPKGKYPRVIARVGDSPPQYDLDEAE